MPSRTTPPDPDPKQGGGARDWGRALRDAAPLLGLGTTLAVTVLVGVGAGYWLDERLGTRPFLLLLGAALGIGAGLYHFVITVSGARKDQADRKQ